jgi:hypothetical protein
MGAAGKWIQMGYSWFCFMKHEINWNSSYFCSGHFDGNMHRQRHAVQYIMGSSKWKKTKDQLSSRKIIKLAAGIEPLTSDHRPALKPLSHRDLLISRASFFNYNKLATRCECCDWWMLLLHSVQTPQADVCKACKHSLWAWCHQDLVFPLAAVAKKKKPLLSHSV